MPVLPPHSEGTSSENWFFFFYFQEQPWRKLASRGGTRLRKWGHISEVTKVLLDSISISSKTRAATVSQHHAPEVLLDVSDPGTDPGCWVSALRCEKRSAWARWAALQAGFKHRAVQCCQVAFTYCPGLNDCPARSALNSLCHTLLWKKEKK